MKNGALLRQDLCLNLYYKIFVQYLLLTLNTEKHGKLKDKNK